MLVSTAHDLSQIRRLRSHFSTIRCHEILRQLAMTTTVSIFSDTWSPCQSCSETPSSSSPHSTVHKVLPHMYYLCNCGPQFKPSFRPDRSKSSLSRLSPGFDSTWVQSGYIHINLNREILNEGELIWKAQTLSLCDPLRRVESQASLGREQR